MHAASLRRLHSHSYRHVPSAVRLVVSSRLAPWGWHPQKAAQRLGSSPMGGRAAGGTACCSIQRNSTRSSAAAPAADAQASSLAPYTQTEAVSHVDQLLDGYQEPESNRSESGSPNTGAQSVICEVSLGAVRVTGSG